MVTVTTEKNWKHSLLYLTFIVAILHLTQQSYFSRKLFFGNETVRIKKIPDLPLRFRSDGTFKILQVADMHYGIGSLTRCRDVLASEFEFCSDLNTTQFLKRVIKAENPDFIAFTGDNIFGSSTPDAAESLFKAFHPAMESGLPWAAVLGNHDQESTMNREELMTLISLMDYSISQVNPSAGSGEGGVSRMMTKIDGFGNYDLKVYGAPGSMLANSTVLNLFFLDSGDRAVYQGVRTYGWIKDSQLHWLCHVSQEFQREKMAATSDEEMESLLSVFDQIYEDVKNGVSEIQSLQSKHGSEIKLRESLQFTCNTLKKENEELAKLYAECLKNVADQLDFRAKCLNMKEELERLHKEIISKEDEYRKAIKLLEQEYQEKIANLEAQVKASMHEKVTYEATINQLNGDIAAHKSHMQVLANRLDQIHFEVESKYNSEVQDLKDCLMAEQEEKNELNRKIQSLQKELSPAVLICKAKMVDQQQEMTSNWMVETLKQKIMKLRKENEVLKRKFSREEESK